MSVNLGVQGQQHRLLPRRRIGLLAVLGAVLGFAFGFAAPATAGTVSSAYGYYTVASVQYENLATITTSSNYAVAFTSNRRADSGTSGTGILGARGRLFIGGSTTNMSCEGTTIYNGSPTVSLVANSCERRQHGTWNSYGVAYAWNGTGYSASYTFNTPNQTS